MDCIVTGFPSKIAALQFEWAWQNTHLTKRIAKEERITKVPNKRKGRKGKEKIPRPRATLADKLMNLQLLLRVPSFARWPLNIRFFCEEAWQQWQHHTQNLDKNMRPGVSIVLDLKQARDRPDPDEDGLSTYEKGKRRRNAIGKGGVDGVDFSYTTFRPHLEKSNSLIGGDPKLECAVCCEQIHRSGQMIVVCPYGKCTAASHITCLARRFLSNEVSQMSVLPTFGHCPKCNTGTQWVDLVKEMSLRSRGKKEVAQLMRKPKITTSAKASDSNAPGIELNASDEDESTDVQDDPLAEDWPLEEDDGDDLLSVPSTASETSIPIENRHLPSVIEDSKWDGAEVLG